LPPSDISHRNLFVGFYTRVWGKKSKRGENFAPHSTSLARSSTQDPSGRCVGLLTRRAHIIALASTRPELATAIAEVQESLTHRWDTTLQEAARRGLIRDDIDTRAFGVIVQSITIGRIVDDAAINHLTNDQWAEAVFALVDRAILGPVGPTG
jgi:hypothetical protein